MSFDFPKRKDWLAYRQKIERRPRYIHVSGMGRAIRRSMPVGVPAGSTYNIGRNKAKREARARRL